VYGAFERRVVLPPETTDADIEATYDAGVLEVTVHGGAKPSPSKAIPVRTSQS
jgi:HSP20 family molecular chaperone IbpA